MVLTRAFLQILLEDVSYVDVPQDTGKASGANDASNSSVAINDFLFSLNIDNINLVKLLQYIKESNIMYKVNPFTCCMTRCHIILSCSFPISELKMYSVCQVSGYGDKIASLQKCSAHTTTGECSEEGSTLSGFRALSDMLLSLTNNDGDGRIIVSRSRPTCSRRQGGFIKFVMLSGEKIFSEVLKKLLI
jgi:chromosome transmission fidelity protein 1